jgi:hypothetical protein
VTEEEITGENVMCLFGALGGVIDDKVGVGGDEDV